MDQIKLGRFKYRVLGTEYDVYIRKEQYPNGRTALVLMDDEGPVATATVNIPEISLEPGEVLIKTWSENESMLEVLVANNIVQDTGVDVPVGYVYARRCILLM